MDVYLNVSNTSLTNEIQNRDVFRWVKVFIAFIVTFLIIFNNLINLSVLWKMLEIGVRMKILLLSLSTSDICLGFIVCLPGLVSGILGYWPFGDAMCQITGLMNGVAISVSLWCLMAISIERFFVVHRPVLAQKEKRVLSAVLGVAFIWTFNTVFFALPIFLEEDFLYYTYDHDVISCSFRWKSTAYFLTAKALYPALSGTVLVVTSLKVRRVLKTAEMARKKWTSLPSPHSASKNNLSAVGKSPSESNLSNSRIPPSLSCQGEAKDRLTSPAVTIDSSETNNETHGDTSNGENSCCQPISSRFIDEEWKQKNPQIKNGSLTSNITAVDQSGPQKEEMNNSTKSKTTSSNLHPNDANTKRLNDTCQLRTGLKIIHKNGNANDSFRGVKNEKVLLESNMMPKSTLRREMKARLLLLCTSAVFFTAISPYSLTSLIEHFSPKATLPHWLKFVALWVLNTNSFINVYIYSAIYAEFRMHCKVFFYKITCRDIEGIASLRTTSSNGEFQMSRKSYQKLSKPQTSSNGQASNQMEELPNLSPSSSACSTMVSNVPQGTQENVCQPGLSEDRCTRYSLGKLVPREDAGIVRDQMSGSNLAVSSIAFKNKNSSSACSINTLNIEVLPSVDV